MRGARTRGQAAALRAVEAMIRGPAAHAVLLVGPEGVGKTTLALDLAAGLLCAAESGVRPCGACRSCRQVERGNHPDVHRLAPAGPGRQVVIGGPDARYRGVRDLISELALTPVEGAARVAIVEGADRMNEDAQSALLKTLEEPPGGVVIVLCADQEDRLMPTVRSRCARVRLGLVGPRDIEAIVADHDLADPPMAARLGRLAGGRPGIALAYARAPDAVLIRAELSRVVLDLTEARPSVRLAAVRAAIPRALALSAAMSAGEAPQPSRTGRKRAAAPSLSSNGSGPDELEAEAADGLPEGKGRQIPATERRRAAEILLGLWMDVARDLVLAGSGGGRSVRDTVMLEELAAVASTLAPGAAACFLARASRSAELLASNVSPELILDTLALAWPRRAAAA